jgi:UDP-glucose 4-epimerase
MNTSCSKNGRQSGPGIKCQLAKFWQQKCMLSSCKSQLILVTALMQIFGSNFPTRDGTCVRDYVHVSDLVDAHLAALKQLRPGTVQIFNVGTGKGVSVREFIAAWIKVTGKQVKVSEHLNLKMHS